MAMHLFVQRGTLRHHRQKGHDRDQQSSQNRLAQPLHAFLDALHNPARRTQSGRIRQAPFSHDLNSLEFEAISEKTRQQSSGQKRMAWAKSDIHPRCHNFNSCCIPLEIRELSDFAKSFARWHPRCLGVAT
jgi:hypothetical protein